jgi:hypothetical protein
MIGETGEASGHLFQPCGPNSPGTDNPVKKKIREDEHMRRIYGACIFLLGLAAIMSAQTITVTKPALNETWVKGQTYAITWTKSGDLPPGVKISLRDKDSLTVVQEIVDPAPNSGSFSWPVPAGVPDGQYRIRVKAKGVEVFGDSPVFKIAAVPLIGTITIIRPTLGDTFWMGLPFIITWKQTGNLPGQVSISLVNPNGTAVVQQLIPSTANSGSVGQNLPFGLAAGPYRVRVKTIGAEVFGDSQVFNVSPDSLKITQPTYGSNWKERSTRAITWTTTGNLPNSLMITLLNKAKNKIVKVIAESAPNTGSFSWTVPGDIPLGEYYIRIKVNSSVVENTSEPLYLSLAMLKMPVEVIK